MSINLNININVTQNFNYPISDVVENNELSEGLEKTAVNVLRMLSQQPTILGIQTAPKRKREGSDQDSSRNVRPFSRTPKQKTKEIKKKSVSRWTKEDDKKLLDLMLNRDPETRNEWASISQQFPNKTPDGIRKRWTLNVNPILKHGDWEKVEDDKLLKSVDERKDSDGDIPWTEISEDIFNGTRSPSQVKRRYTLINPNFSKKWTPEETKNLEEAYKITPNKWEAISKKVGGHDARACRQKMQCLTKPSIKGKWTEEQDQKLTRAVGQFGPSNITRIRQEFFNSERSEVQIRGRIRDLKLKK